MKEYDIRPKALYEEFMHIVNREVRELFANVIKVKTDCPACGSPESNFIFSKINFDYCECPVCFTIFVNPLPDKKALSDYYTDSESVRFFAEQLYEVTKEERKVKIFRPRVELIKQLASSSGIKNPVIVDIGGGTGLLADELALVGMSCSIIEPSTELTSVCLKKGYTVYNSFFEEFDFSVIKSQLILTSFELIEHLLEPQIFFTHAYKGMKSGDLFLFTTLSGTGLDIRVLWENSNSFLPPLNLNFFNPESISTLLRNIGFEILSISTPGLLDVDILMNNKENVKDHFWKYFLSKSESGVREKMQEFISSNLLSSHMRVVVRKN